MSRLQTRWWQLPEGEAHAEVVSLVKALYDEQKPRLERALQSLCLFEGRKLEGLHASAYCTGGSRYRTENASALHWNLCRSLALTLQSKIAGRQRPKPQFVTIGGDWSTIRKARKLDRYVEAQLYLSQGPYETAWDLTTDAFLDAAIWEAGVCKIYADEELRQVCLERAFAHELYVDPVEARYGNPQNLFHRYTYDRDLLATRFPDHVGAIESAKPADSIEYGGGRRRADAVEVYEAWHLPSGDKPGKHVLCIDGATLVSEDWTRKEFPFVWLRFNRQRIGYFGTSLVEELEPITEEVNSTLTRMEEAEKLCSNGVFFYREGSVKPEDMGDNRAGIWIPVPAGMEYPQYTAPQAYSQSTLNWLQMHVEKAYEISGISKMSASSRKEPGVTAGVALRTLSDMETERFSVVAKAYEQLFVSLARHIVACTRELADKVDDLSVKWPGKRFLREIPWNDVDPEEDTYTIRVYPVSSLPSTPAGRLSTVQDLMGAGLISPQAGKRLLDWADLEAYNDRENAEYELVEELIEEMLDATEEALESGDYIYETPESFQNLEQASVQVGLAYFQAKRDKAPEFNLELLRRYITDCDRMIQRKVAAAQPPPPPPGAPPMPPEGAPIADPSMPPI